MTQGEITGFEAVPLRVATALARAHEAPTLKEAARRLVEVARLARVEATIGFATRPAPGDEWIWHMAGLPDSCQAEVRQALAPDTPPEDAVDALRRRGRCSFAALVEGLPPDLCAVTFGVLHRRVELDNVLPALLAAHAVVAGAVVLRTRRSRVEVRAYQSLAVIQEQAKATQDPLSFLSKLLPRLLRKAPPNVTRCAIEVSAMDEFGYGPQRFVLGRGDLTVRRTGLPSAEAPKDDEDDAPSEGARATERMKIPLVSPNHRHGFLCLDLDRDQATRGEVLHFARAVANALATALARMRAEASEARGQSAFRGVLDILPDPVLVHRNGKIIFANERLAEFLGYTRGELVGAPVLTVIAPQDHELVAARIRHQQTHGAPVAPVVEHIQHKDGTIGLAEIAARPALFEGALASIVVARDVTEREDMARRAAEADRLATVGMLAAGIGHEINNPLTYIKGNLQYLRYRLGPTLDEELQAALTDAELGAERIENIAKTIRLLGTKGGTERQVFPLHDAAYAAYRLASQRLDPVAEVTLDIPRTLQVQASEEGVSQLFTRLLFNAADALDKQASRRGRLTIRARPAGDRVEVAVVDNGPGVQEAMRERIFLPFVTTKEVGEGSGLGLAVGRQIVAAHGGQLTVEDTPGGGATFRFSLPGAPALQANEALVGPTREPDGDAPGLTKPDQKLRVLLVDDDPLITEVLRRLLGRSMDVDVAASGAEAIALVERSGPIFDAVVTDVAMPGMSGVALADELAARWPALRPKILLMTGAAISRELAEQLRASPFPRHIKPIGRRRIMEFATQAAGLAASMAGAQGEESPPTRRRDEQDDGAGDTRGDLVPPTAGAPPGRPR